jgi:hypothetical protein
MVVIAGLIDWYTSSSGLTVDSGRQCDLVENARDHGATAHAALVVGGERGVVQLPLMPLCPGFLPGKEEMRGR